MPRGGARRRHEIFVKLIRLSNLARSVRKKRAQIAQRQSIGLQSKFGNATPIRVDERAVFGQPKAHAKQRFGVRRDAGFTP